MKYTHTETDYIFFQVKSDVIAFPIPASEPYENVALKQKKDFEYNHTHTCNSK